MGREKRWENGVLRPSHSLLPWQWGGDLEECSIGPNCLGSYNSSSFWKIW